MNYPALFTKEMSRSFAKPLGEAEEPTWRAGKRLKELRRVRFPEKCCQRPLVG